MMKTRNVFMTHKDFSFYEPWPVLPYEQFKSTQYLLHMLLQAIGKFKLHTPFEPHWSNVALWLTARGVTTGLIPYETACFSIGVDLIDHQVDCKTTWGTKESFKLESASVAELTDKLFKTLQNIGIELTINLKPQEIENPIPFNEDLQEREYNPELANAWWRILISSYRVMEKYHARFTGSTPAVGLMWGTLDLRDARYINKQVPTKGPNAGYIRRNAMDVAQVEVGWWSGNSIYPKPAYFSFIYPQPKEIEMTKIKPATAHWDKSLSEFILDYDDVRQAKDPEKDLLMFFESTYQVEAEKAGWDEHLIGSGEPV